MSLPAASILGRAMLCLGLILLSTGCQKTTSTRLNTLKDSRLSGRDCYFVVEVSTVSQILKPFSHSTIQNLVSAEVYYLHYKIPDATSGATRMEVSESFSLVSAPSVDSDIFLVSGTKFNVARIELERAFLYEVADRGWHELRPKQFTTAFEGDYVRPYNLDRTLIFSKGVVRIEENSLELIAEGGFADVLRDPSLKGMIINHCPFLLKDGNELILQPGGNSKELRLFTRTNESSVVQISLDGRLVGAERIGGVLNLAFQHAGETAVLEVETGKIFRHPKGLFVAWDPMTGEVLLSQNFGPSRSSFDYTLWHFREAREENGVVDWSTSSK